MPVALRLHSLPDDIALAGTVPAAQADVAAPVDAPEGQRP